MQRQSTIFGQLLRISASCLLLAFSSMSVAQIDTIVGEWRGTYNINIGGDRDIVFTITVTDGIASGTFDDEAVGAFGMVIETIGIEGREVHFAIPRIQGEYFGTVHSDLGSDGKPIRIDGDWTQAGEFIPVTLYRTQ